MAEMTKICASVEKQTNKSLPDVCNTNLRNTELAGEADPCVALPSQAAEAAKLVAEAGAWYFDAASWTYHSFPCLHPGVAHGRERLEVMRISVVSGIKVSCSRSRAPLHLARLPALG